MTHYVSTRIVNFGFKSTVPKSFLINLINFKGDLEDLRNEEDDDSQHFKQRPASAEQRSIYDYPSGNIDASSGNHDGRSSVSSISKEEQLSLKDISMLQENRVKREKY